MDNIKDFLNKDLHFKIYQLICGCITILPPPPLLKYAFNQKGIFYSIFKTGMYSIKSNYFLSPNFIHIFFACNFTICVHSCIEFNGYGLHKRFSMIYRIKIKP